MVTALLGYLFVNVREFSYTVINHTGYAKAVGAYFEIMEIGSEEEKEKEEGDGSVSVKDLKYKYPQSERYALDGVTLSFKKGEKVAVVGHNGSGKTTLMAIVARLLRSYEGELHEGGAVVSAVMQDFVHYQMTVKESIELGCGGRELSEEKIFEILKKVELYDFIMSKPKGIDTNIGQLEEDGVELSKGQYQRLAIARLLANEDSNVWILDEPTAFLDPIAEIETYRHIFDLAGDRLVFFISHRLGFAKHADRIIVTEDGRIVEDGSHSELIARENSVYKKMFESQKEWFE
jgi:ATP-binding cassette subfamily B protein